MLKKLLVVSLCLLTTGLTAFAQDWSEYSRGSSEWHRHNRDAMTRPWKYDRGGRLKRGHSSAHSRTRPHRRHHR
jgi:hypothetical protein